MPSTWDGNETSDVTQISNWLDPRNPILSPAPSKDEANLLYFIFMSRATALTYGKNDNGTPNTNVCLVHVSSFSIVMSLFTGDILIGAQRNDASRKDHFKIQSSSRSFHVCRGS